jgi:tRNA(Ile)-lysidine synthase TilS/MesJ
LYMYPGKVGVQNNDYYPLIETLKKLNKLDNLKGWRPLNDYLQHKVIIEPTVIKNKSELELIKENLGIMSWVEKSENGLEQYTRNNCKKAEKIILDLIKQLENLGQNNLAEKKELIKNCVLKLNKFNDSLDGSFIETGEREELCDLFDNIADAVGINIQDYQDGITIEWRDW